MTGGFNHLLFSERGEAVWVTIDRAEDRNSINSALMVELNLALARLEGTPARAVVFTGAGKEYFIGGADGLEMVRLSPFEARAFSRRIQELFNRLEASPLITVAAVNGLCFGGGYEFALACDFRVAAESARIGLPEVKVGLIPGGGGTQRLPRLVGMGRALEMILSGKLYRAGEAADMGLVHRTAEAGRLDEEVEGLLAAVLRQPQYALSLAKRAVYASADGSPADGLAVESEGFSRCFEHDFFKNLMVQQLEDGVLATTEDVSDLVEDIP